MKGKVHYELEDDVAVMTVDNSPVNALSRDVRVGLVDAFERFESDAAARAVVIVGAGRVFIGGADINEFGKPPTSPTLPDVIERIERSARPVIAALHGAALGGGLEVALGAHCRLALAGTALGFPEVRLGLIPGAGGTQRLPRVAGVEAALEMITGGGSVTAEQAAEIGLVDRIVDALDARAAGVAFARELLASGTAPQSVSTRLVTLVDADVYRARREKLKASSRGEVAPLVAVDAIEAAARERFEDGLAEERRLFLGLMDTPQRAGLVHAFFAERRVAKLPELEGVAPRTIANAGVVGGGTMGAGIATAMLLAGLDVTLVERDAGACDKAQESIDGNLAAAVKRGKLDESRRRTILSDHLRTVVGHDALAGVDLVVEAVFEDLELKREVFASLDGIVRDGAILATNTSYLDVDAIAAATLRPADVVGLHFFSPAHVMRLLEIVVADATAPDVVASALALAKRLGKVAVPAGVCDGFIGNRLLARYRAAADHMVLDGASPYAIDAAIRAFGFPMGPYEVFDLAGLDIAHAARQRKAAGRHPRERVPTFADALVEAGRLGRKSGRGYYIHEPGARRGVPDPSVEGIIAEAREAAGIVPRAFDKEEIVRRYLAAMIDEGARVVDEGIARRPLDIDVVLVHGYGFPRWRGGPMKHADTIGLDRVLADIRKFAAADDHFWAPAPLLERLVDEGQTFETMNEVN